jgi:aldose 1-epimerase
LAATILKTNFGWIGDREINLYTLVNKNGMRVSIMNYGGTIVEIITKDKLGEEANVVLRFDKLEDYCKSNNPYLGPLIGRYANRIAEAKFILNDQVYYLQANDNGNTLHGGSSGFDKVIWEVKELPELNGLQLNYISKDGEGGFPGELAVQVVYILREDDSLSIDYSATTNKATPVSLTSHAYFNLSGGSINTIGKHMLQINASKFLPVNKNQIPTGELMDVQNSPMDFLHEHCIEDCMNEVEGGYDHSWVLNKGQSNLDAAVKVHEPVSGRLLTMYTSEPAVQFYTGNFLDGTLSSNNGEFNFIKHAGFCLEAQSFPDSPNQPHFPSTVLLPN